MTLNTPQDSAVFAIPGVTFTTCASPSRGSKENSVWRVRIAPGTKPHLHRVTREEIFVAVKGVLDPSTPQSGGQTLLYRKEKAAIYLTVIYAMADNNGLFLGVPGTSPS